jgi:chemotaxis protein methyltransferase CheR
MTLIAADKFDLSEAEFRQISEVVYSHCGINLHDGKKALVRARIAKELRARGFRSASQYLGQIQADRSGAELASLIDALSTNLTSFFREPVHFQFLRERFLPELMERRRRGRQGRIRVWSAGCSSGQEPYSLAMTLADVLRAQLGDWDAKILATDISTIKLQEARAGIYEADDLNNVPAAMLREHFEPLQGRFGVKPGLRRLVAFRRLNLMERPWPFSATFDCILCRNVMIYFDHPTQEQLVGRFWDQLESGGLLFTGHSESLTGISHRFRYVQPTIYEKP